MIVQHENAIPAEDRAHLIRGCRTPGITGNPSDSAVRARMQRWGMECASRATAAFGLPIKIESTMLSRMEPGDQLVLHADNCKQDAQGMWVPNHTPNRDFSACYYLSDEFEGGDLYFPQHGVVANKQSGLLVIFPSTRHYMHEVKLITEGTFYALLVFMEKANAALLSRDLD